MHQNHQVHHANTLQTKLLHFHNPASSQKSSAFNNVTNYIITCELSNNVVNAAASISTIALTSILKHIDSVTMSSSTMKSQIFNALFLEFKHFENQPNQLFFFQHVSPTTW